MGNTIVTSKALCCFPNVFVPQEPRKGSKGKPKYNITLLFSKDDAEAKECLKKLSAIAQEALESKFSDEGKRPKLKVVGANNSPIKDGDTWEGNDGFLKSEKYPEYAGCWVIRTSTTRKPKVVDHNVQPIIDDNEMYGGAYVRCSVNAYGYDVEGNKGVAFGLNNVQKMSDGPRLGSGDGEGGGASPEEEFSAVAGSPSAAASSDDDPFA